MTRGVWFAIRILSKAYDDVDYDLTVPPDQRLEACLTLARAIRHLAYPDRDVYPKTRRGTKGAPIVRK